MPDARLGDLLIQLGMLGHDRLAAAIDEQERTLERLGLILNRQKAIDPKSVADAVAKHLGLGRPDPNTVPVSADARRFISREWCAREGMVPLFVDGETLVVAVTDPTAAGPLDEISFRSGFRVRAVVASESELPTLLVRAFGEPPIAVGTPSSPPPPRSQPSVPPRPTQPVRLSQAPAPSNYQTNPSLTPVVTGTDLDTFALRPSTAPLDPAAHSLSQVSATQDQIAFEIQALFEICLAKGIVTRQEFYERLERTPD